MRASWGDEAEDEGTATSQRRRGRLSDLFFGRLVIGRGGARAGGSKKTSAERELVGR